MSVPYPNLKHDSINQQQFGIGVGMDGFPMSAFDWQSPPTMKSNPTHTYNLAFIPRTDDVQRAWIPGVMIWVIAEDDVAAFTAFDNSSLSQLFSEESVSEFVMKQTGMKADARWGYDQPSSLSRSKAGNEAHSILGKRGYHKDMFPTLDKVRELLRFAGIVHENPKPLLQYGSSRGEYGKWTGGQMNLSIVTYGKTMIANLCNNEKTILAGDRIFIMIKYVTMNVNGTNRMAGASRATSKDLTLECVFYTSQDNEGPRRCDDLSLLADDNVEQPPLDSRTYKAYVGANLKPVFRDALVLCIGTALHSYVASPISSQLRHSQTPLSKISIDEYNTKPKIEILVDLKYIP
jgi:hypothetical protein